MMPRVKLTFFIWSFFCLLWAQPSDETLANLKFGEYWFGTKIAHEDLEGKVVLFEMWGT